MDKCAIWSTPAIVAKRDGQDGCTVDSPRAGGKYFVVGTVKPKLEDCENHLKVRLTSWLVEQRRLGNPCPEIHTGTIAEARQRRDLRVSERADAILRYLEARSDVLGKEVFYHFYNPYENPDLYSLDREYFSLLAYAACVGHDDLDFLLGHLNQRGLITYTGRNNPTRKCVLTVEGYARLAELEKTSTVSSKAFVAMWFDPSMNEAWERGFNPAIRDAGYEPVRIDKTEHINKIDDEIIAEIRRARFVVADFTHGECGARGGVYYEAGFAHGLAIPVIFACRADKIRKLHLDTRQFNHIEWESPKELREKLLNRITAVIGDGPGRD